MDSGLEALLRGYGNGATLGFSDEGASSILDLLPRPQDPEGYSRQYPAGSPTQDYQNSMRADDAASRTKHPYLFGAGSLAGGAPLAVAAPGGQGLNTAARIASAVGKGATLGGLVGAGNADNRSLLNEISKGAALGGGLAGATEGALSMRRPTQFPAALPTTTPRPAMNPPRPSASIPPENVWVSVPKAGKTLSETEAANLSHVAEAADAATGAKNAAMIEASRAKAGVPINRDAEYYKDLIGGYEKRVAERTAPATVRPPRAARVAKARQAEPVQQPLPGVPEPEYQYHATPRENKTRIAELGLRPEEGGKNFSFKKNQGRIYTSPEQHAEMWAQKLEDTTGQPALRLRTPLSAEPVPGANEAVRIRTEPVPPDRLQQLTPSGWAPLKPSMPPVAPAVNSNQLSLEDLLQNLRR